eukprot:2702403-Pleurochrysis_carterae.AAC.2
MTRVVLSASTPPASTILPARWSTSRASTRQSTARSASTALGTRCTAGLRFARRPSCCAWARQNVTGFAALCTDSCDVGVPEKKLRTLGVPAVCCCRGTLLCCRLAAQGRVRPFLIFAFTSHAAEVLGVLLSLVELVLT